MNRELYNGLPLSVSLSQHAYPVSFTLVVFPVWSLKCVQIISPVINIGRMVPLRKWAKLGERDAMSLKREREGGEKENDRAKRGREKE